MWVYTPFSHYFLCCWRRNWACTPFLLAKVNKYSKGTFQEILSQYWRKLHDPYEWHIDILHFQNLCHRQCRGQEAFLRTSASRSGGDTVQESWYSCFIPQPSREYSHYLLFVHQSWSLHSNLSSYLPRSSNFRQCHPVHPRSHFRNWGHFEDFWNQLP